MLIDNPALYKKKFNFRTDTLIEAKESNLSEYDIHLLEASKDDILLSEKDGSFDSWVSNIYMLPEEDRIENIMLFDTETAHLNGYIVSFAGILYSLSKRKILKEFYVMVNPGVNIDPETTEKAHGITDQDVANKESFSSISKKIKDAFDWADLIVAHNPMYDINVLNLEYARLGEKIEIPPFLDTMKRLKQKVQAKNTLGRLKDPKLEEAAEFFGIDQDTSKLHNALYDTQILTKVFEKALDS